MPGRIVTLRRLYRLLPAGVAVLIGCGIAAWLSDDIRWGLVGLIALFILYPMAASMVWFGAAMKPEVIRPCVFPVVLLLDPAKGVSVTYHAPENGDDAAPQLRVPQPEHLPVPEQIVCKGAWLLLWFENHSRVIPVPMELLPTPLPAWLDSPAEFD